MAERTLSAVGRVAQTVGSTQELGGLLRLLRRREARQRGRRALTYRDLADRTGWSHGVIGAYLTGKVLPPIDRFEVLVRLLGATAAELGPLATARDRVEERRRTDGVPVGRSAARIQPPVPHQLPPAVAGFVGRPSELTALDALLPDGTGVTTPVCAMSGTAGVGKTALAVRWGHQVTNHFPDGQLYVNLQGFGPSGSMVDPAEALGGFLDALGLPPERVPVGLAARSALFRSVLADKRVLVLLDNAADAEQVRPLLPSGPGCLAVVTSRVQLCGLVADGAYPMRLSLLSAAEAGDLLSNRLGRHRTEAEPAAVEDIISSCARLPLALAIAAARAANRPDFPLADCAAELRGAPGLDAFGSDNTNVRAVFYWSYRTLGADAGRLFRLLGLHPGPDLTPGGAASLAGEPLPWARSALAELERAHLVVARAPGRYALHDLLRAYAAELTTEHDGERDRREAMRRVLDYYLHTAIAADRLAQSRLAISSIPMDPPAPGVTLESLGGQAEALAWRATETRAMVAALHQAGDAAFDPQAWRLAWAQEDRLDDRGQWYDLLAVLRIGMAAARRAGDPIGQANMHRGLARVSTRLGRYDDADAHLREALALFVKLGDVVRQGQVHRNIGYVLTARGRYEEAIHECEQALRLNEQVNEFGPAYALTLNSIGWCRAKLGDHAAALDLCGRALVVARRHNDLPAQSHVLDSLGFANLAVGNHAEAIGCYRRAAEVCRELGLPCREAQSLDRLGDAYRAAGAHEYARRSWSRALAIFDELGRTDAERLRGKTAAAA